MELNEINEIRRNLKVLREWVTSFVDPRSFAYENDILLLDMGYHISKAILLSYNLKREH